MAISRILCAARLPTRRDDHLSHAGLFRIRAPAALASAGATITRELPATISTAAVGRRPGSLFCLAPHGVYRAPELARRAVGFYPAFSPFPRERLQARGRSVFCDTFHRRRAFARRLRGFSAACCLVVFGLSSAAKSLRRHSDHLPSRAVTIFREWESSSGETESCAGTNLGLHENHSLHSLGHLCARRGLQ